MTKIRLFLFLLPLHLSSAAGEDRAALARKLAQTHWISYAPTHYYPAEMPPVYPDSESLAADLRVLRLAGFDGLITYSAELAQIPEEAKKAGFRSMLIGIWDPWSATERALLLKAVGGYRNLIAGIVVGNEGLESGRYNIASLCGAMRDLRRITSKPVSSTEPIDWVQNERRLAECSDFLSVNAHPYFSNHQEPEDAAQWTLVAWNAIGQRYPEKPLLFKEVGLPTRGAPGLTEESQKEYYRRLSQTGIVFSYFEAFDATPRFKRGLIEQSWGLWRADRAAKPVVSALPWKVANK